MPCPVVENAARANNRPAKSGLEPPLAWCSAEQPWLTNDGREALSPDLWDTFAVDGSGSLRACDVDEFNEALQAHADDR